MKAYKDFLLFAFGFLLSSAFFVGYCLATDVKGKLIRLGQLECKEQCNCKGGGACTCFVIKEDKCNCSDCNCTPGFAGSKECYPLHGLTYHEKAALEDIKSLKKKIESHCCEVK